MHPAMTITTNRYNVLLCHITGRTSTEKMFDIGYYFINSEREVIYNIVILYLIKIFTDYLLEKEPIVLIINKETALKNTLHNLKFFGNILQIIYQ